MLCPGCHAVSIMLASDDISLWLDERQPGSIGTWPIDCVSSASCRGLRSTGALPDQRKNFHADG